jgi:hypothetical protein
MYIKAECASNWTPQYLDMLGIEFVNAKTLEKLLAVYIPTVKIKTSDLAMKLISELAGLTPMLVNEFVINHNLEYQLKDIILSDNLVKSICLSSKYENVEKAVDLYMIFLLQRLGFYDNRLFAFPQLPHHIYFGNQSKLAIPDFTIMDILSYFRIAVIEDKSDSDKNQNRIEAQLIAETIAIYQQRDKDRKRSRASFEEDVTVNISTTSELNFKSNYISVVPQSTFEEDVTVNISTTSELNFKSNDISVVPQFEEVDIDNIPVVLGITVKGTVFHFYAVRISNQILLALSNQKSTTEITQVQKLGPLNFIYLEDRFKIVQILDAFRDVARECGKRSKRRISVTKKNL